LNHGILRTWNAESIIAGIKILTAKDAKDTAKDAKDTAKDAKG
jgi:hypothetical protein